MQSLSTNIVAVFFNILAIGALYKALSIFFSSDELDGLLGVTTEFNDTTRLVFLMLPAFGLMLISSLIMRHGRVGISRAVLSMRDEFKSYLFNDLGLLGEEDATEVDKLLNNTFGAVRALLLNGFVFIQSMVSVIVVFFMSYIAGFYIIFAGALFLLFLLFTKEKKDEKNEDGDLAEAVEDENMGLTSKSFERMERMRFLARNSSAFFLLGFIILSISLQLEFTHSLGQFTAIFLLMRFVSQIFVPIGVISGAVFPHRTQINTFINMYKIRNEYENRWSKLCKNKSISIIISRSGKLSMDKYEISKLELLKKVKNRVQNENVYIGLGNLPDRKICTKEMVAALLQKTLTNESKDNGVPSILFYI